MTDIIKLSLSELVSNIKDKKISSNEITKAYIERSKKSKNLNCYNEETFDLALKTLDIIFSQIQDGLLVDF